MKGAFKIKSASTWFAKFFIDQLHLALETFKKVVISYQQKLLHWILYSIRVFRQPSIDDFGATRASSPWIFPVSFTTSSPAKTSWPFEIFLRGNITE